MDPEKNNSGLYQWAPALNGDLPKVLVERQDDARFGLRPIQQRDVGSSGEIGTGPRSTSWPLARSASTIGFGKFSSARRRIYAGIGNALYS